MRVLPLVEDARKAFEAARWIRRGRLVCIVAEIGDKPDKAGDLFFLKRVVGIRSRETSD